MHSLPRQHGEHLINVGYYHKRNKDLVNYSDKVVAFIKDDIITNGTKSALEYCKKINKKFVILS